MYVFGNQEWEPVMINLEVMLTDNKSDTIILQAQRSDGEANL